MRVAALHAYDLAVEDPGRAERLSRLIEFGEP
jgi:hypothetical protein